jgi:hypothetical protein
MASVISSLHSFKTMQNPNDRQFVAHYPMPSPGKQSSGTGARGKSGSRSASPTEYAFIMNTGTKSPGAARHDLREVRSHVMKVHLRRQQQKGREAGEELLSAGGDRRKGKQRVRSSRSNSLETEENLVDSPLSQRAFPQRVGIGMVFPGFCTLTPFQLGQIGYGTYIHLLRWRAANQVRNWGPPELRWRIGYVHMFVRLVVGMKN